VFRAALPKRYPKSQNDLSLREKAPKPVQVEDPNRRLRDAQHNFKRSATRILDALFMMKMRTKLQL
jgi:hypothetical protein